MQRRSKNRDKLGFAPLLFWRAGGGERAVRIRACRADSTKSPKVSTKSKILNHFLRVAKNGVITPKNGTFLGCEYGSLDSLKWQFR